MPLWPFVWHFLASRILAAVDAAPQSETDQPNFAWQQTGQRIQQIRHQVRKIIQPVGICPQNYQSYGPPSQILLERQGFVDAHQDIKFASQQVQKVAISQGGPAQPNDAFDLVGWDRRPNRTGTQLSSKMRKTVNYSAASAGCAADMAARRANSRTATACSLVTLGKSARNSSSGSPAWR